MILTEPILTVKISPPSIASSPNDRFTMTCTARAEVDGEGVPVEILRWIHITMSLSGSVNYYSLNSSDMTITGSPESGYQSILTTTENDTVNMIIYRCRARTSTNSTTKNFSDVILTIEGSPCIHPLYYKIPSALSNIPCSCVFTETKGSTTSTPSSETTATIALNGMTTPTSTPSSEPTSFSTTGNTLYVHIVCLSRAIYPDIDESCSDNTMQEYL